MQADPGFPRDEGQVRGLQLAVGIPHPVEGGGGYADPLVDCK
jgi:hypothetical protein